MADIVFEIAARNAKKLEGTLRWPSKHLSISAVSGPFGLGALPNGMYKASRSKLLDKDGQDSYCDVSNNCWMQPLDPQFATDRTDLGIHPDGNVPGTEGCIGINPAYDTDPWYQAFYGVVGAVMVEVRDA